MSKVLYDEHKPTCAAVHCGSRGEYYLRKDWRTECSCGVIENTSKAKAEAPERIWIDDSTWYTEKAFASGAANKDNYTSYTRDDEVAETKVEVLDEAEGIILRLPYFQENYLEDSELKRRVKFLDEIKKQFLAAKNAAVHQNKESGKCVEKVR